MSTSSGWKKSPYWAMCLFLFVFSWQANSQDSAATGNSFPQAGRNSFPFFALRQGDAIRITFYPDSGFFINGTYPIGPDGTILLPLVGKVKIANKTEGEFSSFLNKAYENHLRYPNVQIQPLIRISFLGGFYRPGLYYINPSYSLWEAVRIAGGPVREDGFKKMNWERQGLIVNDRLEPFVESGRSLTEIGFRSGDQLWVTHRPVKTSWDLFKEDLMPTMSFLLTGVTTAVTVFYTYQLINR